MSRKYIIERIELSIQRKNAKQFPNDFKTPTKGIAQSTQLHDQHLIHSDHVTWDDGSVAASRILQWHAGDEDEENCCDRGNFNYSVFGCRAKSLTDESSQFRHNEEEEASQRKHI